MPEKTPSSPGGNRRIFPPRPTNSSNRSSPTADSEETAAALRQLQQLALSIGASAPPGASGLKTKQSGCNADGVSSDVLLYLVKNLEQQQNNITEAMQAASANATEVWNACMHMRKLLSNSVAQPIAEALHSRDPALADLRVANDSLHDEIAKVCKSKPGYEGDLSIPWNKDPEWGMDVEYAEAYATLDQFSKAASEKAKGYCVDVDDELKTFGLICDAIKFYIEGTQDVPKPKF